MEKRVFPHLLRHTFATHALNRGMPLAGLGDRKTGAVILSSRAPHQGLKKNALENIIRNITVRAGLSKRVFPHLLRHTFATRALNKGMPLPTLCDLMGHASVETTRIYAKNSRQKLKYDYDLYVSA